MMKLKGLYVSGVAGILLFSGVLGADETLAQKSRDDDPRAALMDAGRNFTRTEGYHLSYGLRLGLVPQGADQVANPTVALSYRGRYHRGVLRLDSPRLFLTARRGAALDPNSGAWRQARMFEQTRKIAQMVDLPEEHLASAARYARGAHWAIDRPATIVVPVPVATARQNLTTIQNSGCTGAT